MGKSICSACQQEFESIEEYTDHLCITGYKPTQIEHQDSLTNGRASKISAAAKSRAQKRMKSVEN